MILLQEQVKTIHNDVQVFNQSDACINYINTVKHKRVIFIVSHMVDQCILTRAQEHRSVSVLYILCLARIDAIQTPCFRKFKGMYVDMNVLMKQIQFDMRRMEDEVIGLEILEKTTHSSFSSSKNVNKQDYIFMQSQLLKEIFLKFEDDSTSELVEYCRKIYATNPGQLAVIDELERNYNASKAIWWYTKDSFLYKLINKALRTRDMEPLYNMRTLIRHLQQQILQLSPINDPARSSSTLTLYQGQPMPKDDFLKLQNNEGGLLSVSNFLSTSTDRHVAIAYAGVSDEKTIAVVFELTLDVNHQGKTSFACIESVSSFGDSENEWLFSMGAIFRIGKMILLDGIWYVHLTFTNDEDEVLKKLTAHTSKLIQIQRPNPLVPFCRLLARMDEYRKATELCEKYGQLEDEWEMKATLYDVYAWMYVEKDKNVLALSYHQQALDLVLKHVDANDPLLANYHNNVAMSFDAVGEKQQAIEHYQKAIDLEFKASEPDYTNIAYSYESMGHIFADSRQKSDQVMHYYERALKLMLAHLPSSHSDINSLYEDMATIYENENELDKALALLRDCLAEMEDNSQCDPHELRATYEHIARIYEKTEEVRRSCGDIK